jgi:probable F420-dependent oxidoreductase
VSSTEPTTGVRAGAIVCGAQIEPQHATYPELREAWRRAEELGAEQLWTWDHFFPLHGDPDGLHFEAWTLLAGMAEATEQARLGVLVSSLSYRNAHLLADMARTVDHISSGRIILGVGAGWFERDYREYGYAYATWKERLGTLERTIPVLRERLARLNPPPLQERLPILVGAAGERVALRIVAEHADIWNYVGDAESAARKARVLDDWCERVGRDPAEIARSVLLPDDADDYDVYVAAGFTQLLVPVRGPGHDLRPLERLLAWRGA